MKLRKKILPFYCIAIIYMCFALYYNTPYYISKFAWKNSGGGRISDVLIFKKSKDFYIINWPFIYKNNKKMGHIVFCFDKKLWIYSLQQYEDNHIGEYTRFISSKNLKKQNPLCSKHKQQ